MADHGASRKFFDLWSRTYDAPLLQALTYRPVQNAVLVALREQRPRRVVDVGCGTGRLTTRLRAELGATVVGLDYSWGMVAQAARHSRGTPLVQANAMSLPIASGSVDAIVCTESFHWYTDQPRVLGEFTRVLRPGGRIYVALINPRTERVSEWTHGLSERYGQPLYWPTTSRDARHDHVGRVACGSPAASVPHPRRRAPSTDSHDRRTPRRGLVLRGAQGPYDARVTTPATYPNYAGKHAEEAMFTPADFAAYLRRVGALGDYDPPEGIVLCYQRSLFDHVLKSEVLERSHRQGALQSMRRLPSTDGRIGVVGQFGIGAPAAAAALEELAALGTTRFISLGTAGSLQRDLHIGDVVLCEEAIRDEGVSHHYLPPAKLARASAGLTSTLADALRAVPVGFRSGTAWTIDTPYRETVAEARHYQAEGVLCVEMEAAALFAVGEFRGLQVAAAFTMSDSLAELVWDPQFHGPEVEASLVALYHAALIALQAPTPES